MDEPNVRKDEKGEWETHKTEKESKQESDRLVEETTSQVEEENLSKELNIAEETHKSEEERGEDNNKNTEEENKSVENLKM